VALFSFSIVEVAFRFRSFSISSCSGARLILGFHCACGRCGGVQQLSDLRCCCLLLLLTPNAV
jgi:hypothetical protein